MRGELPPFLLYDTLQSPETPTCSSTAHRTATTVITPDPTQAIEGSPATSTAPTLTVDFYFDFVCPWCLIGKRHLQAAMNLLAALRPDVQLRVQWRSQQLLPHIPPAGVDYQSFYLARLGSAEAVAARRAQVQHAGSFAGIEFAFDRIKVMPNTVAAHKLVAWAAGCCNEIQHSALIESLFSAYFIEGEDIGDLSVLLRKALECNLDREGLLEHLAAPSGGNRVQTDNHVNGVPFFVFNGTRALSGAHPPDTLVKAMLDAIREECRSG